LLDSHRGYDPGALLMAQELAVALDGSLVSATVSRLLVDLNRSIGHPQLFSATTRRLAPPIREEILAQYYRPYREQVERLVGQAVSDKQRVIHISSHSFTPELDGKRRHRSAVSPRPAWRKRALCALEDNVGRTCADAARTSQLSLCRQRRRTDRLFATAFCFGRLCRDRT